MWARLSAFVIWSLVAATAVFWALRLSARPLQAPAYAVAVGKSVPIRGDLSRLFGAAPIVAVTPESVPEASSRFKLVGVMAPKASQAASGYGLALIAVDGKPARAYAVGSRLDSDLVLQSVSMRSASLGPAQGNRSVLLELPVLPAPATGVLPAPGIGSPTAPAGTRVPALVPATTGSIAPLPMVPGMQPQAVPQMAPAMQPATAPSPVPPDNFRAQ